MKCIVIQTSPERTNAHTVTNEDGTPYIYATMAEARAELKANGYSYNRENQRYYIKGTEYRAYILRADSEEYAEIMEQAEQQAAPEYIEPEHIQTVSGNKIYRSIDPVTGWNVFTVAGRDFWELAEARYFAQCNPTDDAQRAEAETAAARFCAALTETTGVIPYVEDAVSVCKVARDDIAGEHRSTAIDRDAVNLMTEAIADRAREAAALARYQTADAAAPIYQRYELLAYLGEPDDYDVEAIEAEATTFTADGAQVWAASGDDLAAIAERHQIVTYYAI